MKGPAFFMLQCAIILFYFMEIAMAHCPACDSSNIQRLSMVHASGISGTSTHISGRIDGDFIHGHAHTRSQTLLSRQAAGPTMQTHQKVGLIVLGVIIFVIAAVVFYQAGANGLFWIFVAGGVASIALSQTSFVANWDKEAAALQDKYARTFMCHACGHRFIPVLKQP